MPCAIFMFFPAYSTVSEKKLKSKNQKSYENCHFFTLPRLLPGKFKFNSKKKQLSILIVFVLYFWKHSNVSFNLLSHYPSTIPTRSFSTLAICLLTTQPEPAVNLQFSLQTLYRSRSVFYSFFFRKH